MAWTARAIICVIVMIITGTVNDLSKQWASKQNVIGNPEDKIHRFEHPFFQAVMMFIGQMICLLFFIINYCYQQKYGDRQYGRYWVNPLILAPPAIFDMGAMALMYVGLTLTYPSSFQMLRGTVIIFAALLSVAFLGHNIKYIMWGGMIVVILGFGFIGMSDYIFGHVEESKDTSGIIAGDLLIVMSQILVAVQIVYEEKFIIKYRMSPLLTVGYEGLWGFIILGILLVPFFQNTAPLFSKLPTQKIEDPLDAFRQISNSNPLLYAMIGNIGTVAVYNYAGVSVTKAHNATTRIVIDSIRILVIWWIMMALKWQQFQALQILGYVMVFIGLCLYLDLFIVPFIKWIKNRRRPVTSEEDVPILEHENPDIQQAAPEVNQVM